MPVAWSHGRRRLLETPMANSHNVNLTDQNLGEPEEGSRQAAWVFLLVTVVMPLLFLLLIAGMWE